MIKRIKRKYTLVVMCAVVAVLGLIITAINIANYVSVNSLLDEKVEMLVENEGLMPEVPFGEKPEADKDGDGEKEPEADGENGGGEDGDGSVTEGDGNTEDDGNGGTGSDGQQDGGSDTDGGVVGGADTPETDGNGTGTDGDADNTDTNDKNDKNDKDEEPYVHMSPETPFEMRYFSVKLDTAGTVIAIDTSKIAAVDTLEAEKYAKEIHFGGRNRGYVDSYKYMSGMTKDGNRIYVFLDADRELSSLRSFLIWSLVVTVLGILTVFALVVLLSETALKPIIESYEKQKRFITDAGHEMKTPLTVISANAEIIELENGESQWLTGIKNQVTKLASLTEKLVILSKMEEGAKLEMTDFALSDAFFDTCEQYESIAMSKGVSFEIDVCDNLRIVGNEGEIRRCITLLLDNAFRYVNERGTVSVKAESVAGKVEMRFSNSTDKTEKGSLDKWFDRFYRTDLSRNSDTGGSGIGLSVVKAIVLAHGGTVHAYGDGKNVEFIITI